MKLSLLLGVAVSGLCFGDSMAEESGEPTEEVVVISCSFEEQFTESDQREALRSYLSELDQMSEFQIEDIASLISSEKVHALKIIISGGAIATPIAGRYDATPRMIEQ